MAMVVGLCQLTFRLRQAKSLKDKRRVVRQLVERTRARFAVSIAETGDNDTHKIIRIGLSVVSNDTRHAHTTIDRVLQFMQDAHLAELVDAQREVFAWDGTFDDAPMTMADL
mgnify:CR=1 FL=1